jgi:hypothetical protein
MKRIPIEFIACQRYSSLMNQIWKTKPEINDTYNNSELQGVFMSKYVHLQKRF